MEHENEDAGDIEHFFFFWNNKEHRRKLPHLAAISDRYLCAIDSSCPAENSFSFLSNVMSKRRRCVKSELLHSLFLLWNEFRMEPNMHIGLKTDKIGQIIVSRFGINEKAGILHKIQYARKNNDHSPTAIFTTHKQAMCFCSNFFT